MKKIQKSSELLWLFGIVFVAFGVAICSKADLGVSMIAAPAFVVFEAIAPLWSGFSVGMTEYAIQGVLLILLCALVRRFNWRYLISFLVAIIYGYTLNLFLWILGDVSFDTVALRWVMLIVGDVITAFGVACFFRTYMPLQVYELFVSEVASKFNLKISTVKSIFDISLLLISVILALTLFGDTASFDWSKIYCQGFHSIGLGTLVTTLLNSPLISLSGRLIDGAFEQGARFKSLEKLFKIN